MTFLSLCGFLPFLDAISHDSVANLHSSVAFDFESPSYSGQYNYNDDHEATKTNKSTRVTEDDDDSDALAWHWKLCWSLDLLDTSHVHVDLVFPCACVHAHTATSDPERSRTKQQSSRGAIFRSSRSSSRRGRGSSNSLWRVVATRYEEYATYAVVVATLQVFLRLTHANVTTLFLPLLAQATATGCGRSSSSNSAAAARMVGDAVLVAVTTCGVLASALASRHLGRDAMCAISAVLIVFCQMAVPAIMAGQAGLSLSGSGGRGGTRMAGGRQAAEMFAVACGVSGGLSWAWGALFWAVVRPGPGEGEGIGSVGQAAGAALGFGLGFAQMQCFLLTLAQLKHAAFAYYAVWIWS